jgi:hypothetical protein
MLSLHIESTKSTPFIGFDPDACRLEISGESYPENAAAFYEPVLSRISRWIDTSHQRNLNVDFELRYYNSSSSKAIMNLLELLDEAARKEWDIEVTWRFEEENEIIQESGEEFQDDYERLNFKLIALPTPE